MIKLKYKHNELRSLDWNIKTFNSLVKSGDIKNLNCYDLVVRLFNKIDIKLISLKG